MRRSDVHGFRNGGRDRAIVFVHGFAGHVEYSWRKLAGFLLDQPELEDWDIYSFGYRSTLFELPSFWKGDASLTSLAMQMYSRLELPDFFRYSKLALIGHSGGGLVIQRALLDYPQLVARTSHVCLFATPSAGLPHTLARFYFWNPQVREAREGSSFISSLRESWSADFGNYTPFWFRAVAAEQDRFATVESVVGPFQKDFCRIIPGDHASMINPLEKGAAIVSLLTDGLKSPRVRAGLPSDHPKYDAFLSYNKLDTQEAARITNLLSDRGLRIWSDAKLRPSEDWARVIESMAGSVSVALVLVGPSGLGRTQSVEIHHLHRMCRIIPVILSTCTANPRLPAELHGRQWVDFRRPAPDPMESLERGIRDLVEPLK